METAVIGAGASGIMAAICAARSGASVVIYEHKESAAKKLLITGNGKCNFSNVSIAAKAYHSSTDGEGRIGRILERFCTGDCIDFFEDIGVMHRKRRGGIYPYTDTAESVRSALLLELKKLKVELICDCREISLKAGEDRSHIINGRRFDSVVIACGGCAAPKTGSDGSGYELIKGLGVKLTDIYPALTPLIVKDDLSVLRGVRCEAAVHLKDTDGNIRESSSGELQPYDHGFSGICAMDISGEALRIMGKGERAFVEVDYLPGCTDHEVKELIIKRQERFPERNLNELLCGIFPKKLTGYLAHPIDTRREGYINKLVDLIKHKRYELSGSMLTDFSRAQTIAGGVPIDSIDDNCMLKGHEGIYVTGELLDADGICGGYNLHFAFATGHIAGMASCRGNKDL